MRQEIKVAGMTCGHCANAVTEELSGIAGVESVNVDLVPGEVSTVVLDTRAPVDASDIRAALTEAGDYTLA